SPTSSANTAARRVKNWKLKGNEQILITTIAAMPNIDYTLIMLADSPIIPLRISDIISFVMLSAVFLFGTLLIWCCWLAIKGAAFLSKKYATGTDVNSFKITTIDFWIAWQGPVFLWCSMIFFKALPLPDPVSVLIENSLYYDSIRDNLITSPIAPALIWIAVGCFYGSWRLGGMKTIGKIFAVLLTAGIFYLGTYVFSSVPLGSPLFYALAILLVGSVVGLIVLAKKLK
ncbi:uncharacterized protein METZ01_LOCUS458636, partial [marine metagenome]